MPEHMEANLPLLGVTVVLTPGRSGSSLLTEILGFLGVKLSQELTPARPENMRGFFEDSRIVAVHKELFRKLGASSSVPLPSGWLETGAAQDAIQKLLAIVSQETEAKEHWGFKDPRTMVLLPMWERVFSGLHVVPRYIYAFRHPGAVAASLRKWENHRERSSEAMWLFRTSEALHHTGAKGYFVHYEDWFRDPRTAIFNLASWCGLKDLGETAVNRAISDLISPSLNHAGLKERAIESPAVSRLYRALSACSGVQVDRQALLAEVEVSRRYLERLDWRFKLIGFFRGETLRREVRK